MGTEATFNSDVVRELRERECFTFNHCDRFTTAVPDISSSADGYTTWLELKILKHLQTPFNRVNQDKLQLIFMCALEKASRAWYLIKSNGKIDVWKPSTLVRDGGSAYMVNVTYDQIAGLVKNGR